MLEHLKKKLEQKTSDIIETVKVSDDEREARLEICRGCDKLGKHDFCRVCGCFMPAKTYLPKVSCPLGKW